MSNYFDLTGTSSDFNEDPILSISSFGTALLAPGTGRDKSPLVSGFYAGSSDLVAIDSEKLGYTAWGIGEHSSSETSLIYGSAPCLFLIYRVSSFFSLVSAFCLIRGYGI